MLNCSAPYKMRLLLEKRMCDDEDLRKLASSGAVTSSNGKASAKERNSWSPPTTTTTTINHLAALRDVQSAIKRQQPPRPISMPYNTSASRSTPLVASTGNDSSNNNNISSLKTYIKRLSRLVAPSADWLRNSTVADACPDSAGHHPGDESYAAPLGSAAARMRSHGVYPHVGVDLTGSYTSGQQQQLMSPSSTVGLANVGFYCEDIDADDHTESKKQSGQQHDNKTTNQRRDIPLLRVERGAINNKIDDLSKIGRPDESTTVVNDSNDNYDGYYSDGEHQAQSVSPPMSRKHNALPGQLLPPVQGRSRRQTVAGLVESASSIDLDPVTMPMTNVSTSASNIDPITPLHHRSREESFGVDTSGETSCRKLDPGLADKRDIS